MIPAALLLIAACGDAADDAPPASGPDAARPADDATDFSTPESFPLQFSTSVPAALEAAVEPAEEDGGFAGAVRFADPARPQLTFLRVVALAPGLDRNDAVGLVRAIATDFGVIGSQGMEYREATPPPGHPWAITGYQLRGAIDTTAVEGWLSLGERNGRFFYVMATYPPTQASVYSPAFDRLLDAWVWQAPDSTGATRFGTVRPPGA